VVYGGYDVKKRGKITLSYTSPETELFSYIFMRSLHGKIKKR
jgi:hypothetical protein